MTLNKLERLIVGSTFLYACAHEYEPQYDPSVAPNVRVQLQQPSTHEMVQHGLDYPHNCVIDGAPKPEWAGAVVAYLNASHVIQAKIDDTRVAIGSLDDVDTVKQLSAKDPSILLDIHSHMGKLLLHYARGYKTYCIRVSSAESAINLMIDLLMVSAE